MSPPESNFALCLGVMSLGLEPEDGEKKDVVSG